MKAKALFLALTVGASSLLAANDPVIFRPQKAARISNVDTTSTNSIRFDVSIFGEGAIGSMFILWDEIDLSEEFKEILTKHEFRTNEFYMQNIDREQFEQERMLQLFEDKKREYFKIFPSEIEREKEDRENE